jgi:hypothetical protein
MRLPTGIPSLDFHVQQSAVPPTDTGHGATFLTDSQCRIVALNTARQSAEMHALLQREGLVRNRKRAFRLYTELGLQVRTKRRRKLVRPRIPLAVPTTANERLSLDFVSDQLACGRRFRILNVVDDYTRECVGQLTDISIWSAHGTVSE